MLSLPTKEEQAVSEFFQYVWTCSDSVSVLLHTQVAVCSPTELKVRW